MMILFKFSGEMIYLFLHLLTNTSKALELLLVTLHLLHVGLDERFVLLSFVFMSLELKLDL